MIAVDTNVLVRLVVDDDREQTARARALLQAAERDGERVLVLVGVVLETFWTLHSLYGYAREDVGDVLATLLAIPVVEIEHAEAVARAVGRYRAAGDFPDLLFTELARDMGAASFATFDRKLRSLCPGFAVEP